MTASLWIPVILCLIAFLYDLTDIALGLNMHVSPNLWTVISLLCSIITLVAIYFVPGDKRLLTAWVGTIVTIVVYAWAPFGLLILGLLGKGM
ncbi:MAG: hypothetical protein JWO84_417 [Parcubacteria group bacterium]|nr:hypothetical protein [Parcubacteria group bacterium]